MGGSEPGARGNSARTYASNKIIPPNENTAGTDTNTLTFVTRE
jgi:hypothetical protein